MYIRTCIEGLPFDSLLTNDIYIEVGGKIRLYRGKSYPFTPDDLERLKSRGVREIFVSEGDWKGYVRKVGSGVDQVMASRTASAGIKAKLLRECASDVVKRIAKDPSDAEAGAQATNLMTHIGHWISADNNALFSLLQSPTLYDEFTRHGTNVCFLSSALSLAMGICRREDLVCFSLSALLHDIGLVRISPEIIGKSRPSEEDWAELRQHPTYGLDVIQGTKVAETLEQGGCLEPILHHHERPDGKGYPSGLRADEIHPMAVIIALTDIFDGRTTDWSGKDKEKAFPVLRSLLDEAGAVEQDTMTSFIKLLGRVPKV